MDNSVVSCQSGSNSGNTEPADDTSTNASRSSSSEGHDVSAGDERKRGGTQEDLLGSQATRNERIKMYCLEGENGAGTRRRQQLEGSASNTTTQSQASSRSFSSSGANGREQETGAIPTTTGGGGGGGGVAVAEASTALLEDDSGREVLEIVAASQNKRFCMQQEEMLRRFSDPDVAGTLRELEAELDEEDEEEGVHGVTRKDEETTSSPGMEESQREVLEIVAASQDKRFSMQQEEMLRRFSDPDIAGTLRELEEELDEEDEYEEEEEEEEGGMAEETSFAGKEEECSEEEETKNESSLSPVLLGKEEVHSGLTALQKEAKGMAKIEDTRSDVMAGSIVRDADATIRGEAVEAIRAPSASVEEEGEVETDGSIHMSTDGGSEADPTAEGAGRSSSRRFSSEAPPGAYSVTPGHSSYRSLDVSINSHVDGDGDDEDIESGLATSDADREDHHPGSTAHEQVSNISASSVIDEFHMVEAQLVEDAQASRVNDNVVVAAAATGDDGTEFKLVRRYTVLGREFPVKTIIILVLLLALVVSITVTAILLTDNNSSDFDSDSEFPFPAGPFSSSSSSSSSSSLTPTPATTLLVATNSPSDLITMDANQTRFEDLRSFLTSSNVTPDNTLFDDPNSPQYQALQWLVYDDPVQISTDGYDDYSVIQRYVMTVLFYSTGGPTSWKKSFNFLTGEHECNWKETNEETGEELGVKDCVDKWGRGITTLDMYWNNMTGTLPRELGSLTTVRRVNFLINDLQGTIPSSLENLHDLEQLFLNNNKFEGTVPEGLANLDNLGLLTVYDNPNLAGDLDFLCSGRQEQPLYFLVADCAGSEKKVSCPCCQTCCDMEVSLCCPVDDNTVTTNTAECWDPTPTDSSDAFGER